jgi:hypothetical protein
MTKKRLHSLQQKAGQFWFTKLPYEVALTYFKAVNKC